MSASGESTRPDALSTLADLFDSRGHRLALMGAFGLLLLGLIAAGARNIDQMNTQGIAYLLLARHYAAGDFALALSGYWSPLPSLLMALGMKVGWSDPVAARVAMGFSGLLLWTGTVFLAGVCRLMPGSILAAAWIAMGIAIHWSVQLTTADLPGAALLVWAFALTLLARESGSRSAALWAGACWAGLHYASAPLSVAGAVVLLGLLRSFLRRGLRTRWLLCAGLALGLLLPWWTFLSLRYERATAGLVWAVDRAVMGPPDADRYYPCFGSFSKPEPGRLSGWEDPAAYEYLSWSPFGDPEYRRFQRSLLLDNLVAMAGILGGFGLLGIGWFILAGTLVFRMPGDEGPQTWRWLVLPVLGLILAWLPLKVTDFDARFLYAAYSLLLVSGLALVEWMVRQWPGLPRRLLLGALVVSMALPAASRALEAVDGIASNGGQAALELARKLEQHGMEGPVAGDGLVRGCRTGLYLACLIDAEWWGDDPRAEVADYLECGASLIVLPHGHPALIEMQLSPSFRDLVREWYGEEADLFPLRVFRVIR